MPDDLGPVVDRDSPLPCAPLYSILDAVVARYPDRPAIDFLGKRCTYRELGALVDRAAVGFRKLGVQNGTRVGLCLPNTPYYIVCFFAVLKAGGVVVNYNPLYVERELVHQIEDSGTSIMVTLDLKAIYPKVASCLGKTCLKRVIVCSLAAALPFPKNILFPVLKRAEIADVPRDERHISFATLVANQGGATPPIINPAMEPAVLQYTGGTTGVPKAAILTHGNLTANTEQVRRWFKHEDTDRVAILGVLPFFHVFAMTVVMNQGLVRAGEMILLPRFDLEQVLKTIVAKKPTLFPGVPTIYTAINGAAANGKYDLSSIRYCISGGAPLPVEVRARFEELTGCQLVEGYGLTEASPVVTCNPCGGLVKAGSIGIPLPGTKVEIRDPQDVRKVMPQGEKGEICVSGPQVMLGYWNRPDETAKVLVDGWLRTGDIGYIDGDGYIFLVDRIKDVIICGGYNVYPRMIEEAIYEHPAVAEAIAIGVPDEYRGQAPKLFVKLRLGATATADDLKHYLADRLSPIEMPKAIEIRADLPKTMVGKLSKKELVAEELAKQQVHA